MIDLDQCTDVVEIGLRHSPPNLLREAAVRVRSTGTIWLADWLLKQARALETGEVEWVKRDPTTPRA